MITPVIIQVIFWLGLALIVIGSLVSMTSENSLGGAELLIIVFGGLLWRVYCELLILFFRMNETLTDIRTNTRR